MFLPAIEQATPFNHALVRIQVEFRVLPKVLEEAVGLSRDHLVVELVMHKRGRSISCHQLPLARRERHPVAAGRDLVEGQSVQGKDYADSAQPRSSSMPKPATAGPNTACQRDGGVCAGCSSLRCLAIVSSRSPSRETSVKAASLSCSNKVVLRPRRHPHPASRLRRCSTVQQND